jgi:diacylglycerol kinase family enzyme
VNDIVLDITEQNREKDSPIYLGHLAASAETHSFIGQANWGLGVVVNRWVGKVLRTLPFLRPLQNLIGTLSIIVAHLLRKEKVSLQIQADKTTLKGEYSIVLVSQIRHWASGMRFCPEASYLKPEFQVVTVARCRLFRLIKIILAAKTGGHLRFAEVSAITAKQVEIRSEKALHVQIDGDIPAVKGQEFILKKKKTGFHLAL